MQCHLSLARFRLGSLSDGTPVWEPPPSALGVIDLTPPGLDGDPDVNYALVASSQELDSEYLLANLGYGDPRDLHLTGKTVSLWDEITGFRPQAGTVSNALAQAFMEGGDPTGRNFVRPLSGVNGPWLHIWLAGEIVWASVLSGKNQAHAMKVIQGELQSLRDIYVQSGETAYRKAMWVLGRKYNLKGGVNDWLPANDPTLPRLEPIHPQTTKSTSTWGGDGSKASDFTDENGDTWFVNGASWIVSSGSIYPSAVQRRALRMEYDFGGSDLEVTITVGAIAASGGSDRRQGVCLRHTGTYSTDNFYFAYYFKDNANYWTGKVIAGSLTHLGNVAGTLTAGDLIKGTIAGSTLKCFKNGVQNITGTDTAIASGTRAGIYQWNGSATENTIGAVEITDGISPSSSSSQSSSSSAAPSSSSEAPSSSYPDCRLTAGWYRDWCRRREVRW